MMLCSGVGCFPLHIAVILAVILAVGLRGAHLLGNDKITWRQFAMRFWLSMMGGALVFAILWLVERWHGY